MAGVGVFHFQLLLYSQYNCAELAAAQRRSRTSQLPEACQVGQGPEDIYQSTDNLMHCNREL